MNDLAVELGAWDRLSDEAALLQVEETGDEMSLKHTLALGAIIVPLQGIEPAQLRRVAAKLQQRGGEYTACGQALTAAIDYLYPDAPKIKKKKLGIEEGYGSLTIGG